MNISYNDFLNLTWKEYDYYSLGHFRRIEREWDYNRHIIASMFNSSGFSKKKVNAKDVMKLPNLDKKTKFKMVNPKTLEKMLKIMEQNGK